MNNQKNTPEPPAVVDDGWWESVLAEEERHRTAVPPRPNRVDSARSIPHGTQEAPISRAADKVQERVARPESAEKPPADWNQIKSLYHGDEIVALTVTGFNRGGLLVEGSGLFGFVPFSHLVELAGREPADREKALGGYVGRDLHLKVIECVPEDGRVVFSERAAQAEPGQRSKIFGSLHSGQKVTGQITNITDFGVFVDLGGVEGLIHISELSWGRVAHPSNIVKLGQSVEALVMDVAAERCRVALSLKRLVDNPWVLVGRDYAVDQVLPATITAVLSYGAFAKLDIGVEGLIHSSEIPLEDGRMVKDILQEGQRINVRILHVDASRQRLGLSLNVTPEPVN
jgi:small subunit ribosomal protein S1